MAVFDNPGVSHSERCRHFCSQLLPNSETGGGGQASSLPTRFTVGLGKAALFLHPFHCWARKGSPPTTRFTVGLEERRPGGRLPTYPPWYPGCIYPGICLLPRCYLRSVTSPGRATVLTMDPVCARPDVRIYTFDTGVEKERPLPGGKRAPSPQK